LKTNNPELNLGCKFLLLLLQKKLRTKNELFRKAQNKKWSLLGNLWRQMNLTLDTSNLLLFQPNNDDLLPAKFDLGTNCEIKIEN
jgi:hypothetical protein